MEQLKRIKNFKGIVGISLAIIITLYLIVNVEWPLFRDLISKFNFNYGLIISLLYVSTFIFRAVRLKIILGDSYNINFLLTITFIHGFWNRLLPLKLGEFALPYYLNKYYPNTKSIGLFTLLLIRLSDLLILLLMFIISINFTEIRVVLNVSEAMLLFSSFLLFFIVVFFRQIVIHTLDIVLFLLPSNAKVNRIREKVITEFYVLSFRRFISLIICTFFLWISMYGMFYYIIRNFDFTYSLFEVVFASTFSNLFSVLPFSGIGSFGTLELGWALGYVLIGIPYETALTHGFIVNLIAFIITLLLGVCGYISYLKKFKGK